MSLINKMLKDLENRGGLKNEDSTFESTIHEASDEKNTRKSNPTFLMLSGLFIVIYLAGYYWFTQNEKTNVPAHENTIVNQAPNNHDPMLQQNVVAEVNTNNASNEAIIAEITAAIESEIQASVGEVDEAKIQQMVIDATQHKVDMPEGELQQVILGRVDIPVKSQLNTAATANIKAPVNVVKASKIAAIKAKNPKVVKNTIKQIAEKSKKIALAVNKQSQTAIQATPKVVSAKIMAVKTSVNKTVTKIAPAKQTVVVTKVEPVTGVNLKVAPKQKISAAQPNKTVRKPTTLAKPLGKAHFVKQTNPSQKSEHLYQKAISFVQKGRVTEAQNILAKALLEYPANEDARQTLAALLLDNNRVAEAKTVLSQGLLINPDHTQFRMAVARLEVELGNRADALNTLLDGANQATDNAKYQAFLATMLQRENRHEEAVKHFQYALGIDRGMTKAFVGLGMSLQELNRFEDAQVAYNNAQSNSSITPNLKSFLDGRIKEVNHRISAR